MTKYKGNHQGTCSQWWGSITPAQRRATQKVLATLRDPGRHEGSYPPGISVFMRPSTGHPRHIEVRQRNARGKIIRAWVTWDD